MPRLKSGLVYTAIDGRTDGRPDVPSPVCHIHVRSRRVVYLSAASVSSGEEMNYRGNSGSSSHFDE